MAALPEPKKLITPTTGDNLEIRRRTFTNWINHKLEGTGKKVTNLETDLEDGEILIKLLECLAPGKKLPGKVSGK